MLEHLKLQGGVCFTVPWVLCHIITAPGQHIHLGRKLRCLMLCRVVLFAAQMTILRSGVCHCLRPWRAHQSCWVLQWKEGATRAWQNTGSLCWKVRPTVGCSSLRKPHAFVVQCMPVLHTACAECFFGWRRPLGTQPVAKPAAADKRVA